MKFNTGRFNVGVQLEEILVLLAESCKDLLKVGIVPSINIYNNTRIADRLKTTAALTTGILSIVSFKDDLDINAAIEVYTLFTAKFKDKLDAQIVVVRDIYGNARFIDDLNSQVYVSKDIYLKEKLKDELKNLVFIGKDILLSEELSDALNVFVKTDIFNNVIAQLNLTLQPGQEIEIDSDLFIVYVDNINQFDRYKGGWIELSREAVELIVSTGNNVELVGNMMYKERYL